MQYFKDLPENQQETVRTLLESRGYEMEGGEFSQTQLVDVPIATTPDRENTLRATSVPDSTEVMLDILELGVKEGVLPVVDEEKMKKLTR